jgi:hypothetical protein
VDSEPVRSWRIGGMVLAAIAVTAAGLLVLAGCTRVTGGQGSAPGASVSVYRSFVSESLVTSRSQESKRQESASRQAMVGACTTFAVTSGAAINSGNDLIETMNREGGYGSSAEAKVGPVIDALNASAGQVDEAKKQAQTNELRDALSGYSEEARKLAVAFQGRLTDESLNAVVKTFNDVREQADGICAEFLPGKPR